MSHQWRSSTAAGQPQRHHPQLEPSSSQMARGSRHKSAALGVTFCSTSRSRQSRWCGRRKATVIPARLRAARDPCRMTGLLSMRAMLPRHENMLKAVDKPFGEARPTSGMLRCPDSMVEEMRAATEPITHNPPRIHDRGSTGRMC